MKLKTILLSLLCVLLVFLIIGVSYLLYKDIKSDNAVVTYNKVYGTVSEVGKNYVKVKSLDNEDYVLFTKDAVNVGDFVLCEYEKSNSEMIKNASIDVIAKHEEMDELKESIENSIDVEEATSTAVTSQVPSNTTSVTSTSKSYSRVEVTTTQTTQKVSFDVVEHYREDYNYVSANSDEPGFKEKAKQKFIEIVDFIFYGSEINGVTFNSLKTTSKAKIVYYALLIDGKIDTYFPNYKDSLNNKYQDIKAKLLAKYMEFTINICKDNQENCANARRDLDSLKTSVKLTADLLQKAFSYAYDKGSAKISDWYQAFSGRA